MEPRGWAARLVGPLAQMLAVIAVHGSNLRAAVLKGWWTEAGTPASKLKASILVALAKGVTFRS